MHSRRTHLKLLSAAGLAGMVPGCARIGGVDRLTLAHTLDEQHPVHLAMVRFRDELIRLSGDSIEVEIFSNAQLGTERELVELVQLGASSMTNGNKQPDPRPKAAAAAPKNNSHYWLKCSFCFFLFLTLSK